jgi:hypothetical protein
LRRYEAALPVTVALCVPLVPQEIEYHAPVTSTGSLKVRPMFESTATSVASLPGV